MELFLHDLLMKSAAITQEKSGKTISPTHVYVLGSLARLSLSLWRHSFPFHTPQQQAMHHGPASL
jgi:hypothetical protein